MNPTEFEKWVKDGVTGRAAKEANIPGAAIAQARQAVAFAAKDAEVWKDPKSAVAAICKGTMSGLLLLDQDVVPAAVPLMRNILETSQDCHLDPADAMMASLEGIAEVAAMLPEESQNNLRGRIDEAFMDAGSAFADFVHKASGK